MKVSKKQLRTELNRCLMEQGLDWYPKKLDYTALAILGLFYIHEKQINKIIKEKTK